MKGLPPVARAVGSAARTLAAVERGREGGEGAAPQVLPSWRVPARGLLVEGG